MATPIVIWGRFTEMKYSSTPTAGGVLMKGRIGRYLFEICDCRGNHPTAYIHLPKSYPLDNILSPQWKEVWEEEDDGFWAVYSLYDGIQQLPVHGGLTYDGTSKSRRHGVVLGWDYGHYGDWSGYLSGTPLTKGYPDRKVWSVLEILSEVRDAVSWLEEHRLKKA